VAGTGVTVLGRECRAQSGGGGRIVSAQIFSNDLGPEQL
jgi:hypothetical protein